MTEQLFTLAGRRFVVTGGTRGIGRAISAHFARAGASVIANYVRDDASASALLEEASAAGGTLVVCRADLTMPEGKSHLLDCVGSGPVSGLIHCAATGVHRALPDLTLRQWDFTFALNARAFFDLVTSLLPQLAAGSSIVAVSSEGAAHAFPNYAIVGASKGALESLCRHMALEFAPRGIRVNVLSPGTVLTHALDAFPDRDARLQAAADRSPRGRLTTPEEVACAAHFLCSDAAAGLNGHTLVVDGGQRIRG